MRTCLRTPALPELARLAFGERDREVDRRGLARVGSVGLLIPIFARIQQLFGCLSTLNAPEVTPLRGTS
jgi:hypothetical protein